MKITSLAVIFVMIFFPLFQIASMHLDDEDEALRLGERYNAVLKSAVRDAGYVLNDTVEQDYQPGYGSKKFFRADKERAVDTFYRSLALNFNAEGDPVALGALAGYIPAIAVIDYDGYYIYATESFVDSAGQSRLKAVWSPKKPYAYADSRGNTIQFTLDGFVKVYDRSSSSWVQGFREEIAVNVQIPLLRDAKNFESVRRRSIVNGIQNDLAYVINRHNQYATRYGIDYVFTLPQISQEEWDNGIDDIGIAAFVQGIPVGDRAYNNYAFGSGRLVKKKLLYGSVDPATGIKYYSRYPAELPSKVEETFDSEKEAARAGYFPIR
ncbi:hypothetical protein QWJ34_23995 [Saccharibacillus sp. CPCC 101409]|uniref:hypothetical protein n=1 Tax=Saccharibacillus sp. CPCC 101409 TaxID=3058041 RepID=UPI0026726F1A|nr:hypothetical protein [Saccharibacillus sp. CPCC 101409]MDO3412850.1 hypothetical protein [Saccharibacillus sp. CPCC 101409]